MCPDHLCGRESSLLLPAQQAHLCRRRPRSSSPSIFSRTSSSPARSSPYIGRSRAGGAASHAPDGRRYEPLRVSHGPHAPRVADCPSWHPSRSMSLMSREPMVLNPAAVWCDSTRWRILRQLLFGGYAKPRTPGVVARSTGLSAVAPVPTSPCPADRSGRSSLVTCDKKKVSSAKTLSP